MKPGTPFYPPDNYSSSRSIISSLWLVFVLLVFCTVGVKAASTEALMDMDEAYGQLEQKLNLTDEQKPKVEAILKESRAVIKEIRASDENRLSKARALRKNRDETNKRLATVLNDQQMQTYRELRKEMRDRLKEYRVQKKSE